MKIRWRSQSRWRESRRLELPLQLRLRVLLEFRYRALSKREPLRHLHDHLYGALRDHQRLRRLRF